MTKTSNFIYIFLVLIGLNSISCKHVQHLADISEDRYEITDNIPQDERIVQMIAPYKVQLDSSMNVVIGNSAQKMEKKLPEGRLGNWVSDVLFIEASKRYKGKIDFAVQNYGGLRVPNLDAGPITVREMYEVMPFDNELVVMKVKGVIIKALFERIAQKGGWPISNQVRFVGNKTTGEIISLEINGETFDPSREYTFALPDYVANGGDRCDFLINQEQTTLGIRIRDALIANLQSKPAGVAEIVTLDGRIKIKR